MKPKYGRKQKRLRAIDENTDDSNPLIPESSAFPPRKLILRNILWVLPLLISINLFIYAQVRNHEFTQWDDPSYVSKNYEVSRGLTWEGICWAFTTGHEANWHPVTWISHMVDVQLFGMAPGPHHLVSLFFHIANTLLLFWVLFRMTAAIGSSAFVAGLFAAHPLHVESVAWVAERKDVLSAFFFLLAIWAYITYVRRPDLRRYLLVAALFVLALMSKPMAVTLPAILFLLDIWPLGRLHPGSGQLPTSLRLIREKIPLVILAIVSSAITIGVQLHGGSVVKIDSIPLSGRVGNALASYGTYLGNMLWPADLSAFYPYRSPSLLWIAACFLALGSVSVLVVRSAARHPHLLVGWMWYLVMLAPVIGLIQVGAQAKADRYTYLPLIGIFIIVAWAIPEVLPWLRNSGVLLAIASGIVICLMTIAAHKQASYWGNGLALWTHALKLYPDSHLIHLNAGFELNHRGENGKAMHHFAEALRLNPNCAEAHNAIGVALSKEGRVDEALEHFRLAVRMKPDYADAHCNLGARLTDLGKLGEAILHLTTALKIDPGNPEIHYDMGLVLMKQGKIDEAIVHFSKALQLKPGFAEAFNWCGNALSSQGKLEEAIARYNEALRIKPDFADAHNNLGIALANQGKLEEAIIQYNEALRINPGLVEAHNGLGNAFSYQNKLDDAMAQFKEALRLAPDFAGAHRNLGVVLVRKGKLDDARAQFMEELRLQPDMAEARSCLGDSYLFQRRYSEAVAQYKEALRIRPDFVDVHYNLGLALMNQGLLDEAIVHFTEVLRMAPGNVGAHGNLGIALLNKGRVEESITHLNEVLRVRPDDKLADQSMKTALAMLKKKVKQ
jgi:protein O-mannosyl-transferase